MCSLEVQTSSFKVPLYHLATADVHSCISSFLL